MLEITNGTGSGFQWLPTTGLDNPNIQTPTVTAAAVNQQQIEYTVTFKSGECPLEEKTTVKINDLPVITKLVTTQVARQIEVDVNGMTPTFTIDQMETVYDVPAIVSELPFGWRRIYVTDINDCKTDSTIYIQPVDIKPMPSFSPNGEGAEEREEWTVHNLDQYHSYIVEIFDRYGRKLWEYRTGSFSKDGKDGSERFGWDGTYNNHQMPSDDYWYLITVEEIRKQYTGHFILKR
jgi:gliding motility-associated-like protein